MLAQINYCSLSYINRIADIGLATHRSTMPTDETLLIFKMTAFLSEEPGEYGQYINQHVGEKEMGVARFCSESFNFVSHAIHK